MKGKVVQARSGNVKYQHENLKPHSFLIKGDDGKEYLCHLGDIKTNEDKIYKLMDVIISDGKSALGASLPGKTGTAPTGTTGLGGPTGPASQAESHRAFLDCYPTQVLASANCRPGAQSQAS